MAHASPPNVQLYTQPPLQRPPCLPTGHNHDHNKHQSIRAPCSQIAMRVAPRLPRKR